MTKQEKIQNEIRMAQNRITVKEAYLPVLDVSDLSDEMKMRYHDGILEEYTRIATLQVKLAK